MKRTLGIECIRETKVFSLICQIAPAFVCSPHQQGEADPLCLKRLNAIEMSTFPQKQQPCYFLAQIQPGIREQEAQGVLMHVPTWSEDTSPVNLCASPSYVCHVRGVSMGPFIWFLRTHQCGG